MHNIVAHERKMQSSDLSDNVSGSSDITNRADVVLRYARSADDNGGYIEVAKNRLFGTLARVSNKNQIVTSFDPASRRISTEKSWNMYKVYGSLKLILKNHRRKYLFGGGFNTFIQNVYFDTKISFQLFFFPKNFEKNPCFCFGCSGSSGAVFSLLLFCSVCCCWIVPA